MPATNSVSERSASALRRTKTYLRTTMTQSRLNNVMTYLHTTMTQSHLNNVMWYTFIKTLLNLSESINHLQVLNEFAFANEDRISHVGRFRDKLCCNRINKRLVVLGNHCNFVLSQCFFL